MKKIKQNEATKVIVALEDRTPDLVSNSKDQQVGKFEEPQNMIEAIRYTLLEKKHIGRILWKFSFGILKARGGFWILKQEFTLPETNIVRVNGWLGD